MSITTAETATVTAAEVGRELGAKAARLDLTTPHCLISANAAAAASVLFPGEAAVFGQAYIDGWYGIYVATSAA